MLHGGTQDADDFAAVYRMNALAEEHGFIVAYPHQGGPRFPSGDGAAVLRAMAQFSCLFLRHVPSVQSCHYMI